MRYRTKIFRPLLVAALGVLAVTACDEDPVSESASFDKGVLGDRILDQRDRFGLPAVTTVFIAGSSDKDAFNVAAPENDTDDFLSVLSSSIQARYGCDEPTANALAGVFLPDVQPLDFGLGGPPLGGFPNGRRPEDDVVDVALQLIFGDLGDGLGIACAVVPGLQSDGVDANDVPFLNDFPYLASPQL